MSARYLRQALLEMEQLYTVIMTLTWWYTLEVKLTVVVDFGEV